MSDRGAIIAQRIAELCEQGEQLLARFNQDNSVDMKQRPTCVSWLFSAVNLLENATSPGNRYREEARRLLPKSDETIFPNLMAAMLGIVQSASAEWNAGMLNSLEFQFVGIVFEEFLQHASVYLNHGKKTEAAVLASAVF